MQFTSHKQTYNLTVKYYNKMKYKYIVCIYINIC